MRLTDDELRAIAERRTWKSPYLPHQQNVTLSARERDALVTALTQERDRAQAERDGAAQAYQRLDAAYRQERERADEVRRSNAALLDELDVEQARSRHFVDLVNRVRLRIVNNHGNIMDLVDVIDAALLASPPTPPHPATPKEGT